jgi:DNA repair protein RadD
MMPDLLTPAPVRKQLRDYQHEAVASIFNYFAKRKGNPLVVIPTAGGKSLVVADFIAQATELYPGTRITLVSHVSELIVQNAQELAEHCPHLRITFCSDKLGSKDLSGDVVMGTIQSMYKRALKYPHAPALLLIDECHLLPNDSDTMYRRFIDDLKIINPHLKVVGFTATPFRANSGYLHKGDKRLFTDICYEIGILDLIGRGYLAPLVTPPVRTRMDVHGVKMSGGDYVQGELERAVDIDMLTRACVKELVEFGENRNKWLVFTAGINHCLHVRDEIRKYDTTCEMVTGQTPTAERNSILSRFKSGEIRCVVNVAVYTTGLNVPGIDLMSFMRPTRSPVLYIQMAGRGMRTAPNKHDCLLMDHGHVVETLGPIDQVRIKDKKPCKGQAPVKYCPECGAECFAGIAECQDCGYKWPPHELEIEKQASSAAVLSTQLQTETHDVQSVFYYRHTKEGRPDSLRVEYLCGPSASFRQWFLFESAGRFREEACAWWRQHSDTLPPNTITDALKRTEGLRKPKKVTVRKVGKYFQIVREEL